MDGLAESERELRQSVLPEDDRGSLTKARCSIGISADTVPPGFRGGDLRLLPRPAREG